MRPSVTNSGRLTCYLLVAKCGPASRGLLSHESNSFANLLTHNSQTHNSQLTDLQLADSLLTDSQFATSILVSLPLFQRVGVRRQAVSVCFPGVWELKKKLRFMYNYMHLQSRAMYIWQFIEIYMLWNMHLQCNA